MAIRLIGSRVMVRPAKAATESEGGIVLVKTDQPLYGEVLAVGPGDFSPKGDFIETTVKVGDTVMYTKGVGEEVEFENEDVLIINEANLVGVVE